MIKYELGDHVEYTGDGYALSPDLIGKSGVVQEIKTEWSGYFNDHVQIIKVLFENVDDGRGNIRGVFSKNCALINREVSWEV